jgi:nucleotide-binding universal stress UspA family protein
MINRVLLALNAGRGGQHAISQALSIAARHRASVTALSIVHEPDFMQPGPVGIGGMAFARAQATVLANDARAKVQATCEHFTAQADEKRITYELCVEDRDPVEALADHWRYHDLLVSAHQGLFDHGVVKEPVNLLNRLVGLGIRPTVSTAGQDRAVERILVALSGSTISAKMLKRLCQMRPWGKAPLVLLTVGPDSPETNELLESSRAYVTGHGIPVERALRMSGNVANAILEAADECNVDAIALGDSSRSMMSRRLFGDTSLAVVRRTHLPLFLTH